jgi:endogenous inhibitor of DNA gyrase (YacG/DUF329 family)
MPAAKPRVVTCPQCKKPAIWDASNPYRPFCSERCKLIDLGQWASEGYRIPVENSKAPDEQE